MAEVKNNFIKSKMNKDLDKRLIPSGEYIDAKNAQISMSEGDGVGTLENVLGNELVSTLVFPVVSDLVSIGYFVDQINNFIYVFLTDNYTSSYVEEGGGVGSKHFICRYSPDTETSTILVTGAFLNFSTLNPIYGVNLIENLLFFTDNRNQPRKINVTNAANNVSHYRTEDQISVAKYNPYNSIYLYEASAASAGDFECTMKDVVSKFMPGGGSATTSGGTNTQTFALANGIFPFYPNKPVVGQTVGKILATDPEGPITMLSVTVAANPAPTLTSVSFTSNITLSNGDQLIFFPNPYYNNTYAGDSTFLEDKFVRFSYRFKFEDNEYSLVAPFTQPCFIPKQDGYFMSKDTDSGGVVTGDQTEASESSIVSFMENKVNSIDLQIPLPSAQNTLASDFKITEIEVLLKESDGLVIKAVDTIKVSTLTTTDNFVEYNYEGKKPFKTLLEKETARVFDKVPVRSLAQEVSGNRVIYSNFQNRHTPPASLDYNVNATSKAEFNLRTGTALASAPVNNGKTVDIKQTSGTIEVGSKVSFSGAPANLLVQTVNTNQIVLNQNVTLATNDALTFDPATNDQNTTSRIEYPSSTLKTNRSYQVGVVLSDRYGRTSDVILSNNENVITVGSQSFSGSSLYSQYQTQDDENADVWPGDSLKVLFNSVIGPENPTGFYPGIYNGTVTDPNYNPLGWYSYKIVVQQKEQDYYNVYAPGALKGNVNNDLTATGTPLKSTVALNMNTSRVILLNDNINKVPRDLSEVGPQDKTFRSSVQLIGRVVNNVDQYDPPYVPPNQQADSTASNLGNQQYYPDTRTFTTNTIQPLFDNQDWPTGYLSNPTDPGDSQRIPALDNIQPIFSFYSAETNPFVAEITTSQLNNDNFQFGTVNPEYNTMTGPMTYVPINQLCVLETKPVTSLLDIYYETSTSGLINDLNLAILNDIGISNTLNNFNDTSFTEALPLDGLINNPSFDIRDEFGIALEKGTTTIGQYESFQLTGVINFEDPAQDVSNYFALVENSLGNNLFNYDVKVTQDFITNIYFSNEASTKGRFTLTFLAKVVTAVSPSLVTQNVEFTETITLGNVAPQMYTNRLTPPSATVAPATIQVNPQSFDSQIGVELYGRNGAFPGSSTQNTNPNTALDLSWDIISVTNVTTNTVLPTPSGPFGLEVDIPQQGGNSPFLSRCIVKNVSDPLQSIKAAKYSINLQLKDAGNDVRNIAIIATYGTPASIVQEVEYTFSGFPTRTFVEVKFESSGSQNGWYVFSGTWQDLLDTILFGGNTIQIGGAIEQSSICPGSNNFDNKWWYGGIAGGFNLSIQNVRNKLGSCFIDLGGNGTPPSIGNISTTNTQSGNGYVWNIL
mgnify:FL=1